MKQINGVYFSDSPHYTPTIGEGVPVPVDAGLNDLNVYQDKAKKLAIYPNHKAQDPIKYDSNTNDPQWQYLGFKLAGEVGEFLEKLGKLSRDNHGVITPDMKIALSFELGDILWYVSELSRQLGWTLAEVAGCNLVKLQDRAARNKLGGSGDER